MHCTLYDDLIAGKRPRLAIGSLPQHGKSLAATDFVWAAGRNPNLKTIYASYSDELGIRTNLDLQRMFQSPTYRGVFPKTVVGEHGWQCNTSLIEYAKRRGFVDTTAQFYYINSRKNFSYFRHLMLSLATDQTGWA